MGRGDLATGLHQLVTAEFLYQQGLPPQATYLFKHALIQEAAYQSLLRSTRQQHHQRIAQVLERRFPDLCETQPELLAHHYMGAGLTEPAVAYCQRAGQRAVERSAYAEAVAHLTTGLELLATLPETPERAQHELDMQTTLGPALMVTKGYAAPEVERVYTRAHALCQQVGETPRLLQVLYGLRRFYSHRGDHQTALGLAESYFHLAQRQNDPSLLIEAHYAIGFTSFCLGAVSSAHAHLEQAIALSDRLQERSPAYLFGRTGVNLGLTSQVIAACCLWVLGYPEQALAKNQEGLALAQKQSHPFTLAHVLFNGGFVHQVCREWQPMQTRTAALRALAAEQGFAQFLACGAIYQGWAFAEQGQVAEGRAQMQQGLAAYQDTGAGIRRSYFLALLAEAYGKSAHTAEGLMTLAEALAWVERTGERFYEAELHRLKGELLLTVSAENSLEAEAGFHQALDVARNQQAKSLELRAAMSLARLWQHQGKRTEAHQVLAEVYGWFTEGFDTADLQDAKAMSEELG